MKLSVSILKKLLVLIIVPAAVLSFYFETEASGSKKDRYDIVYLVSENIERVLDYKDELDSIFENGVRAKIKVMGRGDEYALIYDGNDSARTVTKTLVKHAELLDEAGYDEPYATKDQNFQPLYNVSYGMGPNLDPLKKRYELIYSCLGEDVGQNLFIETTEYGNYTLIYRRRGSKRSTTVVARKHAKILRSKKISTSITRENNNRVVYGESSLMDETPAVQPEICELPVEKAEEQKQSENDKVVHIAATKSVQKISREQEREKTYTEFEESIESYIDKLRRKGRISADESTGWMVYDLESDRSIVDINPDQGFQAASMIKPFVALAFFEEAKNGKFKYGPKSKKMMEAMIQRSSNSATNWVMKQAGGPANCDRVLKEKFPQIFKQTEIKEYIPAGGRTYLNTASPSDYVRFLRALWNNELPYGKEIRRLMALPGRDRLYHGTPIPRGTLVYNKTGSTAHLCGDMGILVPRTKGGGRYPYAIVGIIERRSRASDYGHWMDSRSRVIREVSTLVYEQLKREHKLR
jgi:beta-lactamase class A